MGFFKILNPNLPHHIQRVPAGLDYSFNEPKLFKALCKAGATPGEAEALLGLLHDIGWGGLEFPSFGATYKDFTLKELKQILKWYRTAYFNTKTVQYKKTQLDQYIEDARELKQKKLFNYQAPTVHFKNVHALKGRKLD